MIYALATFLAACAPASESEGVTWHHDVEPLVAEHCSSCHQDEGIAFTLDETTAPPLADAITTATAARTMPPWGVTGDGSCQDWADTRWLDDDAIATFAAWADAGAPAGPDSETSEPTPPAALARVDATLEPAAAYTPTLFPDEYRCFIVDPGLTEDRFLTGYQVVPGEPGIVHHVILYSLDSALAVEQAAALDARDEAPGYSCFGSSVVPDSRPLAAWAPGTPATTLPAESGLRLAGGRPLVMQVHYNSEAGGPGDRTRIDLTLAENITREAFVYILGDLDMELAPGIADATTSYELSLAQLGLPLGVFVRGVFPHMHLRGRTLSLTTDRAGDQRCMADVPRWDFAWQQMYLYRDPVYLYPDETLRLTCTFDTTGDTAPVTWGEGTGDEMCLVGLLVTIS